VRLAQGEGGVYYRIQGLFSRIFDHGGHGEKQGRKALTAASTAGTTRGENFNHEERGEHEEHEEKRKLSKGFRRVSP
jgi:hypothetical protein